MLSTSLKQFSLSSNEDGHESRWASFFHQASLGTQLNQQFLFGIMNKKQSQSARDSEVLILENLLELSKVSPCLYDYRVKGLFFDYTLFCY